MIGANPKEWCERVPLGPFESEMKARAAIREDIEDTLDGCELLSPGHHDKWCERYTITERVKSFQPRLDVAVKISLPNSQAHPPQVG